MVILGASFDNIEDNKAFVDKFSFPFLLLSDEDRDLGLKYGAADTKQSGYAKRISYLIDPEGTIVKVYAKPVPADHPGQVLSDLESLQN